MPKTLSSCTGRMDEFIEALKEPSVIEAIAKALAPFIARSIDESLDAKLAEFKSSLDNIKREAVALKSTVAEVRAQVDGIRIENSLLKKQVQEQGLRLEDTEIYSRAHDLIIRGLPEGSYAERATASASEADPLPVESHTAVEASILALCNDRLDVTVTPRDISVAHRLKSGKNDAHRPIIVRFASRRMRDEVLRAKKKLFVRTDSSSTNTGTVFISEHLTRGVAALFFDARKLVRENKLGSAWTHKGLVNVKFTKEQNEKPTIVRCLADLSKTSHP